MKPTASRDETPWVLLSLAPLPVEVLQGLFGKLPVEVVKAESLHSISDADAVRVELILADWRPSSPGLDAASIARLPKLAFVQQPSVGVQSHDAEALAAAGIPLSNVAGFNAAAVMEWTVGATLSISRMLRWTEDELRAGRWPQTEIASRGSSEIAGKSVGIVGFGPIGQGCARVFSAFGCPVTYWSRSPRPAELEHGARYEADVKALVAGSQILINAVALAPQTRGLLSAEVLGLLPPGAMVISNSRGGIVDEDAVVAMLQSGALAGAAFDVYNEEPLPATSPLRALQHDRLLLSPHAAGSTIQSNVALIQGVASNVGRAVSGAPLKDVVNAVSAVVRRR